MSVPLILCWKHMSKREVSYKDSNQAFSLAYASLGITTAREADYQNQIHRSVLICP